MKNRELEFQIFRRKQYNRKKINTWVWYFRQYDENLQAYTRIQSTGVKSHFTGPENELWRDPTRDKALAYATELVKMGRRPKRKTLVNVIDFTIERLKASGGTRAYIKGSSALLEKIRFTNFSKLSINHVSHKSLVDLQGELLESHKFTNGSINKIFSFFRSASAEALKREYLLTDPFSKPIDELKTEKKDRGALTLAEVEKILTLPDSLDLRERALTTLLFTTGLRRSEALAVTWMDIEHGERPALSISKGYTRQDQIAGTKTESSVRRIPLADIAYRKLKALRQASPFNQDGDFIFYSADRNKPLYPEGVNAIMKKTYLEIGITVEEQKRRNLVVHSSRHSFITLMRTVSNDFITQCFVGHAGKEDRGKAQSMRVTDGYSHITDDTFLKAAQALTELFSTPEDAAGGVH